MAEIDRFTNQTLSSLRSNERRIRLELCSNITRVGEDHADCCGGVSYSSFWLKQQRFGE